MWEKERGEAIKMVSQEEDLQSNIDNGNEKDKAAFLRMKMVKLHWVR